MLYPELFKLSREIVGTIAPGLALELKPQAV